MPKISREWCPYCGTTWEKKGRGVGFMINSVGHHKHACENKTPEERVKSLIKLLRARHARIVTDNNMCKEMNLFPVNHTKLSLDLRHSGLRDASNLQLLEEAKLTYWV